MTQWTDEREAFGRLQARLPALWRDIEAKWDFPHTSVVVPSLSVDQEELQKVEGVSFYEERLLFTLIRLRNPRARVAYVTSHPLHPDIVDYYLQLLPGIPAGHARKRLVMVSVYDTSAQPLSAKLLARPRLMRRIREWIGDEGAYLTCYNASPLERKLSVALGVPLNGPDPELLHWGTKSGSRRIFAQAGVAHPLGSEKLHGEEELVDALLVLGEQRPGIRKAVVKLESSFSGEGNAIFNYPMRSPSAAPLRAVELREALQGLQCAAADSAPGDYLRKLTEMGGIVEEFVDAEEKTSPSVQLRISPTAELYVVSTHEQILGGENNQTYLGCRFPASEDYRATIREQALRVGEVLRGLGVVSRFSVDFVATRQGGSEWRCHAIEINLRMGGTTHPFLALEFLTGGQIDENGLFRTERGEHKYYVSTDNLKSTAYRGLLPDDLMDILVRNELLYRPQSDTGVLFHMIGGLSQYGKIGVACFGGSPSEADALYRQTVATLDREVGVASGEGGRAIPFHDRSSPRME